MLPAHLIVPLATLPRSGRLPPLHRAGILASKDYQVTRVADRLALSVIWRGHGWRDGLPVCAPCLIVLRPGEWFSLRPDGAWDECYVVFAGSSSSVLAKVGVRNLPATVAIDQTLATAWAGHLSALLPRAGQAGVADLLDGLALGLVAAAAAMAVGTTAAGSEDVTDHEAWLRAHLDLADAVGHLARAAGVSPATLRRHWQARHGCAPARWLERERHAQAEHLLRETDAPIQRVAGLCGWPDQRHFATAFRRLHGLSPTAWRARLQAARAGGGHRPGSPSGRR